MINDTKGSKIPYLYIFSGYVELDTKKGKIKPTAGSYDLLRDRIIFSKETVLLRTNKPQFATTFKKGKKYSAWFTNINGVLQQVSDEGFGAGPGRVAKVEKSRSFYLPPKDHVIQSMYSQKEGWLEFFSMYFKRNPNIEFTPLPVTGLTYDKFRKPNPKNESKEEKAYSTWYNNIKKRNEIIYGYHILKTRAVVFVFSSDILLKSTLSVTTPDGNSYTIAVIKIKEGVVCATIVEDNRTKLSKGLYKIKITLPKDCKTEKFNQTIYDEKTKRVSYEITQHIDFNIKNPAGEFDIICCDPVSIEESFLTSFSSSYPHLIQALKEREPYSDYKFTKKGEDKYSEMPNSMKVVADRMNWMATKAKMVSELIDADGGYARGWLLGSALFEAIETKNIHNEHARNALALAFTTKSTINAWNDFADSMNAHILDDVSRYVWLDKLDDARYARAFARGVKLDRMIRALSDSSLGQKIDLFQVNTKNFIDQIPGLTNVTKAVTWLDVIISATSTISDGADLKEKNDNVDNYTTHLFNLSKKYIERYGEESFNREAMAEIEKYHLSIILEKAGVDETGIQFAQDSVMTVLAVSCAIPGPTQPIGLLIAFAMGLHAIRQAGFNFIDSAIFESRMQDYKKNKKMLGLLSNIGEENRNFMRSLDLDEKNQKLILQVCIRYEALSGLVRLMTRAGLTAAGGKSEYSDVIEEYKIDKYIERYILNDHWIINKNGFNPVGLDEDWYYENKLNENDRANSKSDAEHKFEWFNNSNESNNASNNVTSNFQKLYPVHFTNSKNFKDISEHFQTIYPDIHTNCIEHSAIYYRASDITNENAITQKLEDNGWKPVGPNQESSISPLHQIRVLIVLKADTPKGIYPASIRVNRVDGIPNIKGPKYIRFIHEIESSLLDSEKPTWAESVIDGKKIKRLGCVFYPFYYLAKEKIFGLKPLAFDIFDAKTKYKFTLFSKMRYSISATVGTGKSKRFLDLGKIVDKKSIKANYNEIPVKIDIEDEPYIKYKVNKNGQSSEVSVNSDKEKMKKMIDNGFLALRTSEFKYPELFPSEILNKARKGAGPFYIRYADSGSYALCPPGKLVIPGGGNCWDSPIEIVMIVWCKKEHTNFARYEEIGLSSDQLPISTRLVNRNGMFDTDGPLVQTNLNYLGSIDKSTDPSNQALFTKKIKGHEHPQLKPLIDALESSRSTRADLIEQIAFIVQDAPCVRHYEGEYDIFAAHFKMNYDVADEKTVMGVRPFSKEFVGDNRIAYPKYYRYSFVDIKMPERIGLDIPRLWGVGDGSVSMEYEFNFQAPTDYRAINKWKGIEDIDEWIGDIPKSIDAR